MSDENGKNELFALPFPWTYDQLQRYAVLRALVEELGGGLRVLDVGGAAADRNGAGFWLPAAEILAGSGADVTVADVSDCRLPGFLKASGMSLPFPADCFDVVSAFDVLEHIPKNERARFLAELGRISSRAVLLSCPTKSPGVEKAEALLNAEIRNLYGLEHGMLVEHRTYGLPLEEEVPAALEAVGMASVSFGYGALSTWLAYQGFRSSFLAGVGAARATEAIDSYWAGQPQAAELSAPFYRRFWIASKTSGKKYLEGLETPVREHLKKQGLRPILARAGAANENDGGAAGDEFAVVEREVREVLKRPVVSAVVVTSGQPAILGSCLDALLIQVVDFTLAVAVWNIDRRQDTAAWLAAHYPRVRVYEGDFGEVAGKLRGDYIFLIDESMNPTADAVNRYLEMIRPESVDSVLAVSAPWRGGFPENWTGTGRSARKKSKGLGVKAGIAGDTSQIREDWKMVPKFKGWVIGDALFFRNLAVHSRKAAAAPTRHSIFLWEYK